MWWFSWWSLSLGLFIFLLLYKCIYEAAFSLAVEWRVFIRRLPETFIFSGSQGLCLVQIPREGLAFSFDLQQTLFTVYKPHKWQQHNYIPYPSLKLLSGSSVFHSAAIGPWLSSFFFFAAARCPKNKIKKGALRRLILCLGHMPLEQLVSLWATQSTLLIYLTSPHERVISSQIKKMWWTKSTRICPSLKPSFRLAS